MPNRRLPVSKIKEMLRLRFGACLSERKIARSCNVSRTTVSEYLNRASEAGLTWPEAADLSEEELYERLFPTAAPLDTSRPLPDWAYVRKEAARPGVTLLLLWEDYRAEHPDGYSRTQFYAKYRAWCETLEPVMRIAHKAGEKVFVDYSGRKVPIANPKTGEVREAEVFVGTLRWLSGLLSPEWCHAAADTSTDFLSGLSVTCPTGVQFRVLPDHRCGLRSRTLS